MVWIVTNSKSDAAVSKVHHRARTGCTQWGGQGPSCDGMACTGSRMQGVKSKSPSTAPSVAPAASPHQQDEWIHRFSCPHGGLLAHSQVSHSNGGTPGVQASPEWLVDGGSVLPARGGPHSACANVSSPSVSSREGATSARNGITGVRA